jgi:hypothetical protein
MTSFPIIRSSVSPIEIVTDMIIERDDVDDDDGVINEVSGEMIIFYDVIEISCSTESES